MASLTINIYSHNFAVSDFDIRGKEALYAFCKKHLVQWAYNNVDGKMVREMTRTYAASNQERSIFRFHIHCYDDFIKHMENLSFNSKNFNIIHQPMYVPAEANFTLLDKREPRSIQIPVISYLISAFKHKLVTMFTGGGKTFSALKAIFTRNKRTVCIIKGMYVEKWKDDVIEAFGKKKGKLMIVRGSKDLKQLIELGLANEIEANFIIITNTTLFNYFYEYERYNGDHSYGCDPIDLFKVIKAGVRLIDELHQDFHLNFRIDLYTHIPETMNLSATMKADDPFLNKMYELAFPPDTRCPEVPFDKYISVKALRYTLNEPKKLKWKNWIRKSYSHVIFEQSIIKQPRILENYLKLIAHVVQTSYWSVREPGQKMLIFAATVEMCTLIANYLKPLYPGLVVFRYTSGDDYEAFVDADIGVSTLKSAGTAVDIPGLRITFMTDSINSQQANNQVLGRTRPLKGEWAHITPEFLYLVCNDIPKQNEYHERKIEVFADKVLSHQILETGFRV